MNIPFSFLTTAPSLIPKFCNFCLKPLPPSILITLADWPGESWAKLEIFYTPCINLLFLMSVLEDKAFCFCES